MLSFKVPKDSGDYGYGTCEHHMSRLGEGCDTPVDRVRRISSQSLQHDRGLCPEQPTAAHELRICPKPQTEVQCSRQPSTCAVSSLLRSSLGYSFPERASSRE